MPAEAGPAAPLRLTLQDSPDPAAPLWERTLPAWAWRRVLGDAVVRVSASDPSGRLLSARGGRTLVVGSLPGGHRDLVLDADGPDWFWVEGGGAVRWSVDRDLALPPVTVVMPSLGREVEVSTQAARFAAMDVVSRIVVVDQGGSLAADPAFAALAAREGRIDLLEQGNRGGSGGYARGMLASRELPGTAVFLGDDDAVIGAESLRRMLTYQALAPVPTILGTGLFDAASPQRLMAHAEAVAADAFHWGPADGMHGPLDLTGTTPADWDVLLPRRAPNYTGWWGTLLPPGTVEDLGLPAPYFLKWDDSEYGLRATAAGYEHAVLPGASVHHPTWSAHRTQMTWTARVMHRNRLATAAAHGAGRGVLAHSLLHQVKHVLAGHHLTARLWADGIDAVLEGPAAWLGGDLDRARAEGQRIVADWRSGQRARSAGLHATRTSPLPLPVGALRALARWAGRRTARPVVLSLPAEQLTWRTTLGADGVLVTGDAGEVLDAFVVEPSEDRRLLRRALGQHLRLARRWGRLRRDYARALPAASTAARWEHWLGPDPIRDGGR